MTSSIECNSMDVSYFVDWAVNNDRLYDGFILITDDEHKNFEKWSTTIHDYRRTMNIPDTKSIIITLNSQDLRTMSDDVKSVNIRNFDKNVSEIIDNFINLKE